MKQVTKREYSGLESAYQFFDARLFGGCLPDCLITLNRKAGSKGYFSPERYQGREDKTAVVHELALNPDTFDGRSDLEILSTLVHEQAHVWQQHFGEPSRSGYHNKQWADKMQEVGLMPSDTGLEGGKRTGQRVTHYIIEGGRFDVAAREFLADGFKLGWQSPVGAGKRKAPESKVKYSCFVCDLNAWAKPEVRLICGTCESVMLPN